MTEQTRILAIGPHPDDVESSIGGMLVLAAQAGYEVHVICPLVASELTEKKTHSQTNAEHERLHEARQAADVLGACFHIASLYPYTENATACQLLTKFIREIRPTFVFVNDASDAHPFHEQVGKWVIDACFLAQLSTVNLEDSPWKVSQIYTYKAFSNKVFLPNVYIDITPTFATARRALRCHRQGLAVLPGLLHWAETLRVYYGLHVGRQYAEGLCRVGGAHMDHMDNWLKGLQFVVQLNEFARNLLQKRIEN